MIAKEAEMEMVTNMVTMTKLAMVRVTKTAADRITSLVMKMAITK